MRAVRDLFQVIESFRNRGKIGEEYSEMIHHINIKLIPTTGFILTKLSHTHIL